MPTARRCRNGHDLTLPGAVIPWKSRAVCRVCQRRAVRRYQKTAKGRAAKARWLEGKVPVRFHLDPDVWYGFLRIVGKRNATKAVQRLVEEFVRLRARKSA